MSLFRANASSSTLRRHRNKALKKQKGRCFFCKQPLQKRYATADHMLARSKGGKDSAKNIVAACWGCNQAKGSKVYEGELRNTRCNSEVPSLIRTTRQMIWSCTGAEINCLDSSKLPFATLGTLCKVLEQIVAMVKSSMKSWWAVQGSNLWPLPCQGKSLAKNPLFTAISNAFDRLTFTTSSYTPWATLGGERS